MGCALGNSWSCHRIGYYFSRGWHVEQDLEVAAEYYTRACLMGQHYSCQSLADSDMWDYRPEEQHARAILACLYGDAGGCTNLGGNYLRGEYGIRRDRALAIEFYRIGCADGYDDACEAVERYEGQ